MRYTKTNAKRVSYMMVGASETRCTMTKQLAQDRPFETHQPATRNLRTTHEEELCNCARTFRMRSTRYRTQSLCMRLGSVAVGLICDARFHPENRRVNHSKRLIITPELQRTQRAGTVDAWNTTKTKLSIGRAHSPAQTRTQPKPTRE